MLSSAWSASAASMVYDVSTPADPAFVQYLNNRDFNGDTEAGNAGDLGPEGLVFIPAVDSPTGQNLLAAANEISGTTTVYSIQTTDTPIPGNMDGNGMVGREDIAIIRFHRDQPATVFPSADMDGDGMITIRDSRIMVRDCSRPGCR